MLQNQILNAQFLSQNELILAKTFRTYSATCTVTFSIKKEKSEKNVKQGENVTLITNPLQKAFVTFLKDAHFSYLSDTLKF